MQKEQRCSYFSPLLPKERLLLIFQEILDGDYIDIRTPGGLVDVAKVWMCDCLHDVSKGLVKR